MCRRCRSSTCATCWCSRAFGPLECRRRVRHLPLPDAAAERAWLLLLARSRDAAQLTRRSEWFVTKSPVVTHRPARDQVPDLVRAAALLRSVARAIAQGALLSRRRRRGSRSSTRSSTSSITSIPSRRHPPHRARRRHRTRRTATASSSSSRSPRWCTAYLATRARSRRLRVPAARLRRARSALRRRRRHDVPEVPVVSAALHRAAASSRRATPTRRASRSSRCKRRAAAARYTEDDLHVRAVHATTRRGGSIRKGQFSAA